MGHCLRSFVGLLCSAWFLFSVAAADEPIPAEKKTGAIADPAAIDGLPEQGKNWASGPDKNWFVHYDAALAEAKRRNCRLYILNTGSDWCGFCIALRKEVFDERVFQRMAAKSARRLRKK